MARSEDVNRMKNADLNEKSGQPCNYDYNKVIYYSNGK